MRLSHVPVWRQEGRCKNLTSVLIKIIIIITIVIDIKVIAMKIIKVVIIVTITSWQQEHWNSISTCDDILFPYSICKLNYLYI